MGWFDEQIRQRKMLDQKALEDSFASVASAVMGSRIYAAFQDDRVRSLDAIGNILRYYHIKPREVPDSIRGTEEQLEYLLRPNGIMHRTVKLEKGWYHDAIGAMLAQRKSDGAVVALIPGSLSGYSFVDDNGETKTVNRRNEDAFEAEAIAFYKPFPLKKLSIASLLRYMLEMLSVSDVVLYALSVLAVTLIGMLVPWINKQLFSSVINSGSLRVLAAIGTFFICATLSQFLISTVQSMLMNRISIKMDLSVQAATMMRVLSLPPSFFKEYSSGELASRAASLNSLCSMLLSTLLSTGLSSVFSLVYITQIFSYAPALVVPALLVILLTLALSVATTLVQTRLTRSGMELSAKESGMNYSLIAGIQKIKLSGAEKRAFARWGRLYAREAKISYDPPLLIKINSVISTAITLGGTIALYAAAIRSGMNASDYFAFNSAYGMVSGAFISLAGIATTVAQIRPVLEMVRPIMQTVPEVSEGKQVISRLSGAIELNNVTFRYNESMPPVLDNLSLKIRPGQYVAIVGKTGCGKSTLLRLLMGFETPQKGAIYYDGHDLSGIDLKSLRQKMGVVTQNGKLMQGDIFSNIVVSAPTLSLDDAWEAAEMAGIADDIRAMPMGMFTVISEGSGGISGGQRQRLMIARAIAPKPRILMFDEATSALDNITQKKVSESLDRLKCTRVVIAHRLSTIRQCDRILVLDHGHIIEDGSYDELMAQNGFFAELVERQRLDVK